MVILTVGDKSYELDLDSITNREGMEIERVTGRDVFEWLGVLMSKPTMKDATALVWTLQKRDTPGLAFDDVEFTVADWLTSTNGDETPAESPGKPARQARSPRSPAKVGP